jgi:hypothetical protein
MNRILKRPMFRKGGSTNGIMTDLERPGYQVGGLTEEDLMGLSTTARNITEKMYPQKPTDINKFLINFGLDLVSRSPQGGLLSTAATAAKAPTQQLYQDIEKQKEGRAELESGLFGALVKARGEALSGGEGTRLAKLAYKDEVIDLNKQMRDNYNKLQTGQIGKEEYITEQANLTNQMLQFADFDPRIKAKYGTSDAIDAQKSAIKKELLTKNPDLAEDPIALEAAILEQFNNKFSNDLLTVFTGITYQEPEEKAGGGRIGYQNAGPVMPSAMPSNMPAPGIMSKAPESMDQGSTEPGISYDELRARLPSEITDDIVRLISESPQALEDFATIQSQQDVNNFNTKYGVNLTLPPEA